MACPRIREALCKRSWVIRRAQGFASVRCDTPLDRPVNTSALFILLAKLSGAFLKGTELTMVLSTGASLTYGLTACVVLPMHICVHVCLAEDP